jgi:hypothetical protein
MLELGGTMYSVEQCVRRISCKSRAFLLIGIACYAGVPLCTAQQGRSAGGPVSATYELYSWQTSIGNDWKFCLLPTTSREKTVKEVFNEKTALRGVDQIKRKISELPAGSTILWASRLPFGNRPKAKGSEILKYPPAEVLAELRQYAQERNVEILGPPTPSAP